MSEETAKIDKVLQAFLEETTKVLRQHKEAVTRLTAVVEQVIQNSKIEHVCCKRRKASRQASWACQH